MGHRGGSCIPGTPASPDIRVGALSAQLRPTIRRRVQHIGRRCGGILHQGCGLIAFFSKQLPPPPRHTSLAVYERELMGLVLTVRHW
jgi:hypothetical protein